MSITLPPLPISPPGQILKREVAEYATAYATAAVEAYRASRVPMTEEQMYEMCTVWMKCRAPIEGLVRAVEAHHGIGGKT